MRKEGIISVRQKRETHNMMDILISRIVANIGIDNALAQKAVGILLNFIMKNGDAGVVGKLMGAMPGAGDLAAMAAKSALGGSAPAGGGGLGGMLGGLMGGGSGGAGGLMGAAAGMLGGSGGGMMEAVGQLAGAGLSMDQARGVGSELMGFAREKAGDDVVKQLAASIPGLDKFL